MHGFRATVRLGGGAVMIAGVFGCSKSEPPEATPGASSSPAESTSAATALPENTSQPAPADVKYTAGQCDAYLTANRQANASTSSTCAGTEQALFAKDGTGDCLGCLFQSGCLDDTNGDTGQECEDLKGSAAQSQCLAVLRCDIGSSPASSPAPAAGLVVNAYCGVGVSLAKCTQEGPAGKCSSPIAAAFPTGFTSSQIVSRLADRAQAGGVANAIAACGVAAARTPVGAACAKCFR
jgi:hypothetical protein